jgi:hypothetical protein
VFWALYYSVPSTLHKVSGLGYFAACTNHAGTTSWQETAPAAVRLAGLAPYPVVATQGHALTVPNFLGTLAVEATIHHLDMIVEFPAAPLPSSRCLALVRRTLDGLLGTPVTIAWDDTTYALKGTGRSPLTDTDRTHLARLANRFPLLG